MGPRGNRGVVVDEVDEPRDRLQLVVEIVRQPARQAADRLHLRGLAQPLLGQPLVLHIGDRPHPLADAPVLAPDGEAASQHLPPASVVPAHTIGRLERLPVPKGRCPLSTDPLAVSRVHHRECAGAAILLPALAGVRLPAGRRLAELPRGVRGPDHLGGGLCQRAVPALALAQGFTRLGADLGQVEARRHAGQQLARREGLDQVVVGAGLEPLDARLLAGARRQHDDRDARACAGRRAAPRSSPKPSRSRHHHVGEHQVGRSVAEPRPAPASPSPTASTSHSAARSSRRT